MLKKFLASIFIFSMMLGISTDVSAHHYDHHYDNHGHYCDQYGCH